MRYSSVRDHAHDNEFEELFEALEVKRSGYYIWLARPASARTREDVKMKSRFTITAG